MGKGKLVTGIIVLIIGVGLIPASIGMNRHIENRMDLSVYIGLSEVRFKFIDEAQWYALQWSMPETMLELKNSTTPDMPRLVNGSVSAQYLAFMMNNLSASIGFENATDWFFNDPSWSASTTGDYDVQGISEYAGLGNLSFSSSGRSSIYNRLRSPINGQGVHTFLDEVEDIVTEIGQFNDGGQSNAVAISGIFAFVAEGVDGIEVLNISDLSNIAQVGSYNTAGEANEIVISGDYAFVADGSNGIEVLDISDITSITQADQFDNGGGVAMDLVVTDDHLYVADGSDGLEILNITDGWNITDTEASQLWDGGDARAIQLKDDLIYIADGSDGLEIINITDPNLPFEEGQYSDGGTANDLFIYAGAAYIADGTDGLEIYDVTDKSNPIELGQYDDGGVALSFVKKGNYGLIGDSIDGLEIIDISNTSNPLQLGYDIFDGGVANGLARNGTDLLFVADDTDGIEVFNISNPSGQADVMDDYNSNWEQILNVSTYISDHLIPSVPTIANIPFEVNSANAEKLFYMQWANSTFLPDSYKRVINGLNVKNWEFDRSDLNLSFADVDAIWNTTDTNAPLNGIGIRTWIRASYNSTYADIIKAGWSLNDSVTDGLLEYFFDTTFINSVISRIFPVVSEQSLFSRGVDIIYLQWANGTMRPEGLGSLEELYTGFEVTLEPDDIGLNITQLRALWHVNGTNALRNEEGLPKWFDIARSPLDQRMDVAASYNITQEFDLDETQINLICAWLFVYRDTSKNIVQSVEALPLHPDVILAQVKIGTYIGAGVISLIGLAITVKSLRKER